MTILFIFEYERNDGMNLEKLKKRLDGRENIELHNGDDIAIIGKSKLTNDYVFIFNTKVLIGLKTFSLFKKKVIEKINEYSLIERIKDN